VWRVVTVVSPARWQSLWAFATDDFLDPFRRVLPLPSRPTRRPGRRLLLGARVTVKVRGWALTSSNSSIGCLFY